MSVPDKHNISRTLWRIVEISLFFLVSVLGHNFLAKTSTFNAKSKSREHSSKVVAVQCCFGEEPSIRSSRGKSPASVHEPSFYTTPFYTTFHKKAGLITPPVGQSPELAYKPCIINNTPLFLKHQVFII